MPQLTRADWEALFAKYNDGQSHALCRACRAEAIKETTQAGRVISVCTACGHCDSRRLAVDTNLRYGFLANGALLHYTASALVERAGKYLLFLRRKFPYCYTFPAGHIDVHDAGPRQAMARELKEETGLSVAKATLVFKGVIPDQCLGSADFHHWHLYKVTPAGRARPDYNEGQRLEWFLPKDIPLGKVVPALRPFVRKFILHENVTIPSIG